MQDNVKHSTAHQDYHLAKRNFSKVYGLWSPSTSLGTPSRGTLSLSKGIVYSPNKGFTLIELMIVVIIIAALAAMVVPRLGSRSEQAKVAVAQADINSNIGLALKLYKLDNGRYPTTSQGLKALLQKPTSTPVPANWNGPYLEKDPTDPWNNTYQYKSPGAHNADGYDLYSLGTDGVEGNEDDVVNW